MRQEWADYRVFWREFRRSFQATGAVLPSGRALAAALARHVREGAHEVGSVRDSGEAVSERLPYVGRRILEVGPGTGSVTARILRDMRSEDRLVLVERNAQFVARLRERLAGDPALAGSNGRVSLVHAGVEELSEDAPFDLIISGLPLNNFPAALVEELLAKLRRLACAGGTLSFFEYVAVRRVRSLLGRREDRTRLRGITVALDEFFRTAEVRHQCVLANVPPAWVHHVEFTAG